MMRSARSLPALLALAIVLSPLFLFAQASDSPAAIQKQIDDQNAQIAALNKEIQQYQIQLDQVSTKKQTLQNTLSQLDLSIKKITASVKSTQSSISKTQLEIQQLSKNIGDKQASIDTSREGLAESIRRVNENDQQALALQLLSSEDVATAWEDVDATESLQDAVGDQIGVLSAQKQSLTDTKTATEEKKAQLQKQQASLVAQQGSLQATKKAQSELLAQTKSQESNYQAILAQKRQQQSSFEAALNDLQSKLQVAVDPSKITAAGKGVLAWPVDKPRVTQYFGNTAFAASGAYSGKGHNGIDIGIPIGTPLRAALTGTVIGTGNTDSIRGCYSFGKWVMIKHANGLNTMYAHLSSISVSNGQNVGTGQVIGYSGETGYATGPHLHFGVYVSSATQIMRLGDATKSSSPCSGATMPITPLQGYLNPLNYL